MKEFSPKARISESNSTCVRNHFLRSHTHIHASSWTQTKGEITKWINYGVGLFVSPRSVQCTTLGARFPCSSLTSMRSLVQSTGFFALILVYLYWYEYCAQIAIVPHTPFSIRMNDDANLSDATVHRQWLVYGSERRSLHSIGLGSCVLARDTSDRNRKSIFLCWNMRWREWRHSTPMRWFLLIFLMPRIWWRQIDVRIWW